MSTGKLLGVGDGATAGAGTIGAQAATQHAASRIVSRARMSACGLQPQVEFYFHCQRDRIARGPLAGADAKRRAIERNLAGHGRALTICLPTKRNLERALEGR